MFHNLFMKMYILYCPYSIQLPLPKDKLGQTCKIMCNACLHLERKKSFTSSVHAEGWRYTPSDENQAICAVLIKWLNAQWTPSVEYKLVSFSLSGQLVGRLHLIYNIWTFWQIIYSSNRLFGLCHIHLRFRFPTIPYPAADEKTIIVSIISDSEFSDYARAYQQDSFENSTKIDAEFLISCTTCSFTDFLAILTLRSRKAIHFMSKTRKKCVLTYACMKIRKIRLMKHGINPSTEG